MDTLQARKYTGLFLMPADLFSKAYRIANTPCSFFVGGFIFSFKYLLFNSFKYLLGVWKAR